MSLHAPGQWNVIKRNHGIDIMPVRGPMICEIRTHDSAGPIANLPQDEANARLIAAAPDLLDLLKAAVARVSVANAEGDPILSAWMPDALAVIAKAQGA